MKTIRISLVFAGITLLGLSAPVFADDERNEPAHSHEAVTLDQLPTAAQKSIQKHAKGKQIEELFKESENGKTVYEAEVKGTGGEKKEIRVDSDGKLLEHEHYKK